MQSLNPRDPWHWLAFLAVLWWSLLGGLLIFVMPYLLPLFIHADHSRFLAFWATAAANEWIVSAVVLIALRQSETALDVIGLEWPSRRSAISMATLALALFVAILVRPERVPGGTFPGTAASAAVARAMLPWTRADRLFMLLVMSSTAAACEELVYRGFTLAFLRAMVGLWPAAIIQALLFGYMHGGAHQGLSGFIGRAVGGLVFAAIAIWRGNLGSAMALHFFVDASFFSLG